MISPLFLPQQTNRHEASPFVSFTQLRDSHYTLLVILPFHPPTSILHISLNHDVDITPSPPTLSLSKERLTLFLLCLPYSNWTEEGHSWDSERWRQLRCCVDSEWKSCQTIEWKWIEEVMSWFTPGCLVVVFVVFFASQVTSENHRRWRRWWTRKTRRTRKSSQWFVRRQHKMMLFFSRCSINCWTEVI